jgi:uncharacterized Rmd1/YagE family protein
MQGSCIAYCTAEHYDLDALQTLLLQRNRVAKRYGHDVLHIEMPPCISSFDADAFVFKDGTLPAPPTHTLFYSFSVRN